MEGYNHHEFRGKSTWEELPIGWQEMAGYVHVPGALSTSVSFKVAMQFAMPTAETGKLVPTLFLVACHNYYGFSGFRMDSALHSAHPHEQEILFQEGTKVAVLGGEDLKIEYEMALADPFWAPFTNRVIHVIYLFHAW